MDQTLPVMDRHRGGEGGSSEAVQQPSDALRAGARRTAILSG